MHSLDFFCSISKITNKDLADLINCNPQQINDWKKGKRPIPKKYIPELCRLFNVSEEVFDINSDSRTELILDYYKKQLEKELGKKVEITVLN